jgi:hypothetical protein
MEKEESLGKVKKRGGHSVPINCMKCGVLTPLNAYELCAECRKRTCKDCKKVFNLSKSLFDRCSPCQLSRRNRLKRHQDF